MKRLIIFYAVCVLILFSVGAHFFFEDNREKSGGMLCIVELNEIEHLISDGDTVSAAEKTAVLRKRLSEESGRERSADYSALYLSGISALLLFAAFFYIAGNIVIPFEKLTAYADKLASGDLTVPLGMERGGYFKKFTWALDNMRKEINNARICEKEAIENNKTVIASLSHDIKTPVASIRAYTEALEANMDTDAEKRAKYIGVILRKCNDVTRITNDMLLHSLSDMDKLNISPENFELGEFVKAIYDDISAGKNDIVFSRPAYFLDVSADKNRTAQIIENLVNNARKYAGTQIDISVGKKDGEAFVSVRDYGKGVPDEDIPFVFDKFYRGKNSGEKQGTGLGLYIVKYIAARSGGEASAVNLKDGFSVTVTFPPAKKDS